MGANLQEWPQICPRYTIESEDKHQMCQLQNNKEKTNLKDTKDKRTNVIISSNYCSEEIFPTMGYATLYII